RNPSQLSDQERVQEFMSVRNVLVGMVEERQGKIDAGQPAGYRFDEPGKSFENEVYRFFDNLSSSQAKVPESIRYMAEQTLTEINLITIKETEDESFENRAKLLGLDKHHEEIQNHFEAAAKNKIGRAHV